VKFTEEPLSADNAPPDCRDFEHPKVGQHPKPGPSYALTGNLLLAIACIPMQ
jgi:hypothetical protein